MLLTMLKGKIHRATVTGADLNYEGSISICSKLREAAKLHLNEKVDIYNINNGERFSTYIIEGKPREICLNGAAARLVQPSDKVILVAYCQIEESKAKDHKPIVVLVDEGNNLTKVL